MSPRHRSAVAIAHGRSSARPRASKLGLHLPRRLEVAGEDQRLGEVGADAERGGLAQLELLLRLA